MAHEVNGGKNDAETTFTVLTNNKNGQNNKIGENYHQNICKNCHDNNLEQQQQRFRSYSRYKQKQQQPNQQSQKKILSSVKSNATTSSMVFENSSSGASCNSDHRYD